MTEADVPPPERPKPGRQESEQQYLREDVGMTQEGLGSDQKPAEHLPEDAVEQEREVDDKSLIDKAKDRLSGQ